MVRVEGGEPGAGLVEAREGAGEPGGSPAEVEAREGAGEPGGSPAEGLASVGGVE